MSFGGQKETYSIFKSSSKLQRADSYFNYSEDEGDYEHGFMEKIYEKDNQFYIQQEIMPEIPSNQRYQIIVTSEKVTIIVSDKNMIYRYRKGVDSVAVKYELPPAPVRLTGLQRLDKLAGQVKEAFIQQEIFAIEKVFLDTVGNHCLIWAENGDAYYFGLNHTQIYCLAQMRDIQICSLWWLSTQQKDLCSFLYGNDEGEIKYIELRIKNNDAYLEEEVTLLKLYNDKSVLHLKLFRFLQSDDHVFLLVVASTNSSIFYFYDEFLDREIDMTRSSIETLFQKYSTFDDQKNCEFPFPQGHTSRMEIFMKKDLQRLDSFIWSNGNSIAQIEFPGENDEFQLNKLRSVKNLNFYQSSSGRDSKQFIMNEIPIGLGLTQFHYYILNEKQLQIFSLITEEIVVKFDLQDMDVVQGIFYVEERDCFWIYSQIKVQQLIVYNEDQDAWKILINQKDYETAYQTCQLNQSPFFTYIAGIMADEAFNNQRYFDASNYFLESNRTLEEVFLQFNKNLDDDNAAVGLQNYLFNILEIFKLEGEKFEDDDEQNLRIVQRKVILIYLVELLENRVKRLNDQLMAQVPYMTKGDIDLEQNRLQIARETLQDFLNSYLHELDEYTVYQIMQSHGHIESCIEFAQKKNRFDMILLHYINEEKYTEALGSLANLKNSQMYENIYRFSHILLKELPEQTVEFLKTLEFEAEQLIGSIVNIPDQNIECGINLLKYCMEKLKCQDRSIQNALIFFLYTKDQKELINYFVHEEKKVRKPNEPIPFNVEYALRICQSENLDKAIICIYSILGMNLEAVEICLQTKQFEAAKKYAQQIEDKNISQKIWIQEQGNLKVETLKEILVETEGKIKIDDILGFFDEDTQLSVISDDLLTTWKSYDDEMKLHQQTLEDKYKMTERMKGYYDEVINQNIVFKVSEPCKQCFKELIKQEFYIYPCTHGFHKNCLKNILKQQPAYSTNYFHADQKEEKLKEILNSLYQSFDKSDVDDLLIVLYRDQNDEELIEKMKKKNQNKKMDLTKQVKEFHMIKRELDQLIAFQCPLCGIRAIDKIYQPFEIGGQSTWDI